MTAVKAALDTLHVILLAAVVVLGIGFFGFCIVSSFTGDGITDAETDVAIRLCVAFLGTVLVGRLLEIVRRG